MNEGQVSPCFFFFTLFFMLAGLSLVSESHKRHASHTRYRFSIFELKVLIIYIALKDSWLLWPRGGPALIQRFRAESINAWNLDLDLKIICLLNNESFLQHG